MQSITVTQVLLILGSSVFVTLAVFGVVVWRDRPWQK
jgi:uncharacterized protein (DUF486 family)